MADQIQVSISQASVQEIIQAHVHTAVTNALLPHSEHFVREMVEKVLLAKSTDEKYRYSNDSQKPTWLEHVVRQIIAEEATKAIKEWAVSHRDQIAEQLRKRIGSQGFAKQWAAQLVEDMLKAHAYNFTVNVTPAIREKG